MATDITIATQKPIYLTTGLVTASSGTYDAVRDAFIPPKPSADSVLDEMTCTWSEP